MGPLDALETALVGVSKQLPQIPKNAKKTIADIVPWLVLLGGIVSLWSAWALWSWARVANVYADWANSLSAAYGTPIVSTNRFTIGIWIALLVVVVEAILFFVSFPALRAYKKSGWNILFIVSFINIVYGIVMLFTNYGGISSLFFSLIGTAIGWYLLFQVREVYLSKKVAPAKVETKAETKK
jgi:hypothetical protein